MLRLLIADDDPVEQQAAAAIVRSLGHDLTVVGNGREVLRIIEKRRFDAVLMDLHMPVLDGIAATREIFETYASERRPMVIALIGSEGPDDVPRVLEAGARACLRKPIDREELTTLLKAIGSVR